MTSFNSVVMEVCKQESVQKLEKFLVTSKYKELAESAMSFNRKLNEERKMRIPYVDNQVPYIIFNTKPTIFKFLPI